MQNFWVTDKEYYGILWYFLGWSIIYVLPPYKREQVNVPPCGKCFLELVLAAQILPKWYDGIVNQSKFSRFGYTACYFILLQNIAM